MENRGDIVLEASTRRDFIDELLTVPGGERIRDCTQCGVCSGSCPVAHFMDNTPRRLFAMIRAGLREQVLESQSLWLCTSCYTCTLRCPRGIAVTDIIYALKRLAMNEGKASGAKATALAASFVRVVNHRGRNLEPELLFRYYLKTDAAGLFRNAPLGLRLIRRGRFPVFAQKIRGLSQIHTLIAKAEELGGL